MCYDDGTDTGTDTDCCGPIRSFFVSIILYCIVLDWIGLITLPIIILYHPVHKLLVHGRIHDRTYVRLSLPPCSSTSHIRLDGWGWEGRGEGRLQTEVSYSLTPSAPLVLQLGEDGGGGL